MLRHRRAATVRAVTACELFKLDDHDFEHLVSTFPEFEVDMKHEVRRYIKQLPVDHETREFHERKYGKADNVKADLEPRKTVSTGMKRKASGRQSITEAGPMSFVDNMTPCKIQFKNGHAVPAVEQTEEEGGHETKAKRAKPMHNSASPGGARRARSGTGILKMDMDEFIANIVRRQESSSDSDGGSGDAGSVPTGARLRQRRPSALRDLQAFHEITGAKHHPLARQHTQSWRSSVHRATAGSSSGSPEPEDQATEEPTITIVSATGEMPGGALMPELFKIEDTLKRQQNDEMRTLNTIVEQSEHQQQRQERDRKLLLELGEKIDNLSHSIQQLKRLHGKRGRATRMISHA